LLRAAVITGYKKSGKTETVEGLVRELVARGHRVATIKHIPRADFSMDQPGKDTWRHAKAGASPVISINPGELATIEKRSPKLEDVLRGIHETDFVLIEGFKEVQNIAKVAVARDDGEASKLDDEFTVGFIGHGVKGKPVLNRGDVSALADLVERKAISPVGGLDCRDCGYESCREFSLAALAGKAPKDGCKALHGKVILTVDGKQVPLKSFMQDLVAGVIRGMLSSLKYAEGEQIELRVVESGSR
jgi:molybdopterin-guanine dinucleotide biosynthesis protein B